MREPRSTNRPGKTGEPDKVDPKSLKPLRRLLPFLLRYPWRVALTLCFLLIAAVTSLAIPAIAGKVIDQGFIAQNLQMVANYGWLIIAIAAVMAAASAARFYFVSILGERVLTDLRRNVFDHLLTLDATFFDTHRVGTDLAP
jgi:ATP-binding cassette subfamily B protein